MEPQSKFSESIKTINSYELITTSWNKYKAKASPNTVLTSYVSISGMKKLLVISDISLTNVYIHIETFLKTFAFFATSLDIITMPYRLGKLNIYELIHTNPDYKSLKIKNILLEKLQTLLRNIALKTLEKPLLC